MPEEEQPQPTGQQGAATASDQPASAATPSPNKPGIAPGSVIPVRLSKTVDAKKAKPGDPVEATITQDMKTNSGEVLLRKDAKVVGHVTEVQARSKEQKESQVGIAFDRVSSTTNGQPMPVPMSIQAVIAPPNQNPANGGASSAPSSAPEPGTAPGARGGMGGSPATSNAPQTVNSNPQDTSTQSNAQQPITGNTQGVVGISNLTLSAAPDATQGSLLSSEKNNVKLEDGTFLLLRVNSGTVASPQK
jgi:hypothetical protein